MVLESRIRYLRQGSPSEFNPALAGKEMTHRSRMADLCNQGIRFNGSAMTLTKNTQDILAQMKLVNLEAEGDHNCFISLEGQNEYDLPSMNGGYQTKEEWLPVLKQKTIEAANVYRNDPEFSNVPIIASSWTHKEQGVEDGFMTPYVDYTNSHPYINDWSKNPYPESDYLLNYITSHSKVAPTKPHQVTEFGYTAANGSSNDKEIWQAKLIQRQFLMQYKLGVERSYVHEFLDLAGTNDEGFGIVHYDGRPKKSYNMIKTTISLLEDKNKTVQLRPLEYKLSFTNPNNELNDSLEQTLFQKSDGSYYLFVWLGLHKDADISSQSDISLDFKNEMSTIEIFKPVISEKSIDNQYFKKQIDLTIDTVPTVIKMQPRNPSKSLRKRGVSIHAFPIFNMQEATTIDNANRN